MKLHTWSFRRKIIFAQFLLFIIFLAFTFPFVGRTVNQVVKRYLDERTRDLIEELQTSKNEKGMIDQLNRLESLLFFRVSLLNDKGQVLYDSHLIRHLGEKYVPFSSTSHPEVEEAIKKGEGFQEAYSETFEQKFVYVAILFDLKGSKYIIRTAFPLDQVQDLTTDFEKVFFLQHLFILPIFIFFIWLMFNRLSRPIQHIINAIKPYQKGEEEQIPEIVMDKSIHRDDDFYHLAEILNSLTRRVQSQLNKITDERNEKEAILESLGEGVIAVDADMIVRYVNFIGSKMLGIPKRHLLNKPFPVLSEKPIVQLLLKCRALLEASQERQSVLTDSISMGDARKLYLDLIAAPKAQGHGAIIVLQDKSSHYKVLEMGKDFVANASHELRTPITIIKGFAETLQDLPELSLEMLSDITEKIVRNCERMDTLVKNLLTLADIENLPESRFQECDIVSLIDNCVDLLVSVHPETIAHFEKSDEIITVSADPDLLELAIMNLLENSVKYSTPPARITIQLQRLPDEAKVVISDKGIGIPAQDLEHIFERFYTVNKAHSRRLGGAGLGLSIVRTIIEKHDGSISVASVFGEGTTFTILLPNHRA